MADITNVESYERCFDHHHTLSCGDSGPWMCGKQGHIASQCPKNDSGDLLRAEIVNLTAEKNRALVLAHQTHGWVIEALSDLLVEKAQLTVELARLNRIVGVVFEGASENGRLVLTDVRGIEFEVSKSRHFGDDWDHVKELVEKWGKP